MDDITNKQFAAIEARIDALDMKLDRRLGDVESGVGNLGKRIDEVRGYMTGTEMRLATAITGLAGAIPNVKALMVDRDDTKARLAKLEEKLERLAAGIKQ